jgi:hypothetical protein
MRNNELQKNESNELESMNYRKMNNINEKVNYKKEVGNTKKEI